LEKSVEADRCPCPYALSAVAASVPDSGAASNDALGRSLLPSIGSSRWFWVHVTLRGFWGRGNWLRGKIGLFVYDSLNDARGLLANELYLLRVRTVPVRFNRGCKGRRAHVEFAGRSHAWLARRQAPWLACRRRLREDTA
jgi:hypothetical protein